MSNAPDGARSGEDQPVTGPKPNDPLTNPTSGTIRTRQDGNRTLQGHQKLPLTANARSTVASTPRGSGERRLSGNSARQGRALTRCSVAPSSRSEPRVPTTGRMVNGISARGGQR